MFSSMKVCQLLSRVRLFANPWAIALQAPLSVEFSRQERWSGLPCPSPGDLPNPGIEPRSLSYPALDADSLPLAPPVCFIVLLSEVPKLPTNPPVRGLLMCGKVSFRTHSLGQVPVL